MASNKNLTLQEEELLSEEVRNYPCIYDKSKKPYKKKDVVKNAWENVALKLDFLEDGENFFDTFFT